MTRICVLGNSHMGAIRRSRREIAQKYPDLDIRYFGAPGRLLRSCYIDDDGFFGPVLSRPADAEIMRKVNGAARIDIKDFDVRLIIGYQFHFLDLLRILFTYDVLGMAPTGKPRICSEQFFEELNDAVVNKYISSYDPVLGRGLPFVVSPAPYPSKRTLTKGIGHKPAVANLNNHPDGTEIFERFLVKVEKSITDLGHRFLRQPHQTVVGPYITHDKYARGAVDIKDEDIVKDDFTHMNGDFGLVLFDKFAQYYL